MYFFSIFAGCKPIDVLKKFGQVCLRAKAVGIGNLLNCFLCESQLLFYFARNIFVDDGFRCLSCYSACHLGQVSCANIQFVGIKFHVAIGAMVLGYVVAELVKQFATSPNYARMLWLKLGYIVACINHGFEKCIASVYEFGNGGRHTATKSVAGVAFAFAEKRGEKCGFAIVGRGKHVGHILRWRMTALQ